MKGFAFWTEALRVLIDTSLYIVALGIIRWNDIMSVETNQWLHS